MTVPRARRRKMFVLIPHTALLEIQSPVTATALGLFVLVLFPLASFYILLPSLFLMSDFKIPVSHTGPQAAARLTVLYVAN